LKNGRGENDEVSRKMWKAVEASSGKVGMGKVEEGRSKKRSGKETRRKRKEIEI